MLLIVRQFRSSEILAKLAFKLALFGMAVWLAVPGGITVSRMIEATYETSLSQTIEDAQSAADAIGYQCGVGLGFGQRKERFLVGYYVLGAECGLRRDGKSLKNCSAMSWRHSLC